MEANAETLFDYLGKRYEAAFADSPDLHEFVKLASNTLPPHSRVLDIGCGTGKPVAKVLTDAGHHVHGIDVSQEMVQIACSQIQGTFEKADMRTFQPKSPYDGVFTILSLFQITPGETYSMCFKWSEWLKPGGILVVGVTPSTALAPESCVHDATWDCSRQFGKPWMDKYTNEMFVSENGWRRMLRDAGFEIGPEVRYSFTPNDPDHKSTEIHYLVMATKAEEQPLLGPYPSVANDHTPFIKIVQEKFTDQLLSKIQKLSSPKNILSLGSVPTNGSPPKSRVQFFDGPVENLPFPSDTFDIVVAVWRFDTAIDMKAAVSEIARVTRQGVSEIVIIQGAPDNEAVQLLDSAYHWTPVDHQGRILRSAMNHLEREGFGDVSLRRINEQFDFPDQDLSERCKSAAEVLTGKPHSIGALEDFIPRLRMHFEGSKHEIGNQMVALHARPLLN